MMDHSVEEHIRTYHRWINQSHYENFYQLMINKSDRPKPPTT
jgi:hypothetical protein